MRYTIEFRPSAARDLRKLSKDHQRRIVARIDSLAANPRPSGVKQLAASEKLYRIRVGDYRILYQIHDKVLRVLVVRIGHRRDVYRSAYVASPIHSPDGITGELLDAVRGGR